MTVYLVIDNRDYYDHPVVQIFTTNELAQKWVSQQNESWGFYVDEMEARSSIE